MDTQRKDQVLKLETTANTLSEESLSMDTERKHQVLKLETTANTLSEESLRLPRTTRITGDQNYIQDHRNMQSQRSDRLLIPKQTFRPSFPRARNRNPRTYIPLNVTVPSPSMLLSSVLNLKSPIDVFRTSSIRALTPQETVSMTRMLLPLASKHQKSARLRNESRLPDDVFNTRINMIPEGNMICQICEKVVKCAVASDEVRSQMCCVRCARRWSINTSQKIKYHELEGTKFVEFDKFDRKITSKKSIKLEDCKTSQILFKKLSESCMPEDWGELGEERKKMYELLYVMLKADRLKKIG